MYEGYPNDINYVDTVELDDMGDWIKKILKEKTIAQIKMLRWEAFCLHDDAQELLLDLDQVFGSE